MDATQLIYPPDHTGYARTKDVHAFLKKSGVLKVDLGIMDVQMLVDRLWYDGKVTRIRKLGGDVSGYGSMSEDDGEEEDFMEVWMYRTVRGHSVGAISGGGGGVWWTDTP
ncbi:hypothetical protein HDU99_003816, partial [Rhizoclosmatium hyalinum]